MKNNNEGTLEMELTDYMHEQMKTTFDLQIPMLQGEYKKLDNGMHWYKISVPSDKVELLIEFFKHIAASKSPDAKVKIMGVEVHKTNLIMNQENKYENKDFYANCNGCGIGMSESEINYTNDEGYDYCNDCNKAIQSDDESSGRLNKIPPETIREAAKAEMGVDYEPHMSQTDQSFIQGAEFGAKWQQQKSYSEQKWVSMEMVQQILDWLHGNISASVVYTDHYDYSRGVEGAEVDYFPETTAELFAEVGITNPTDTASTYTQEQMLAFGERVKEKCASDAEITYDFGIEEVDKQSIFNIDISKLLKTK